MKYDKTVGNVNIRLDTSRIDGNLERAQDKLDMQVLNDMIPYMPMQQGALRGATQIVEPGLISTNTPYAHYQYTGELYLAASGSSWAQKGERKYPAGKPLNYHHPDTGERWFERAKQQYGKQWIEMVKREAGRK